MTTLEIVAVVASLASVIYSARRHVWTWPTGIVAVLAYFVVFVRTRLYADAVLQLFFLGQSVYGWHYWSHTGPESRDTRPITILSARERTALGAALVAAIVVIWQGLERYTNAASPLLDATVSSISLAANLLLARKVIDNWALWIVADILYVVLFVSRQLHLSAGLYAIFVGLAVWGLVAWRRELRAAART